MARLGDLFPEDERRRHIREQLIPGHVLFLHCPFTDPPKKKYLVLVSATAGLWFFAINSRLNDFRKQPHIRCCQVELRAENYGFLHHDSFLDCCEIIDYFGVEDVVGQLAGNLEGIAGTLTSGTRAEIIAAVKQAVTLSAAQKAAIIAALTS